MGGRPPPLPPYLRGEEKSKRATACKYHPCLQESLVSAIDGRLPMTYLKPEEAVFSQSPALVTTVLGSCVSVTLYNRRFDTGGICHSVLPSCRSREDCTAVCRDVFKYVYCSVTHLVERFEQMGIRRAEIEAKLFGGSDVMSCEGKAGPLCVGKENVEAARHALELNGLKPISGQVGGRFGRKLYFFTHTGEVLVKRLGRVLDTQGSLRDGPINRVPF
jgi:chemotaxis protein CheD